MELNEALKDTTRTNLQDFCRCYFRVMIGSLSALVYHHVQQDIVCRFVTAIVSTTGVRISTICKLYPMWLRSCYCQLATLSNTIYRKVFKYDIDQAHTAQDEMLLLYASLTNEDKELLKRDNRELHRYFLAKRLAGICEMFCKIFYKVSKNSATIGLNLKKKIDLRAYQRYTEFIRCQDIRIFSLERYDNDLKTVNLLTTIHLRAFLSANTAIKRAIKYFDITPFEQSFPPEASEVNELDASTLPVHIGNGFDASLVEFFAFKEAFPGCSDDISKLPEDVEAKWDETYGTVATEIRAHVLARCPELIDAPHSVIIETYCMMNLPNTVVEESTESASLATTTIDETLKELYNEIGDFPEKLYDTFVSELTKPTDEEYDAFCVEVEELTFDPVTGAEHMYLDSSDKMIKKMADEAVWYTQTSS